MSEMALVKLNEYKVQRKNEDGSMTITLPRQYVADNEVITGDKVAVYRDANDLTVLVVKVEKQSPE